MNYSIMLSLRLYLAEIDGIRDVKMIYDGQELTGLPKPFLTVESLQTNDSLLSAGRRSYEEIYRFQIGIFAQSIAERMKLEGSVKEALRNPEGIPLRTDSGILTDVVFHADVDGFTPLTNDDGANVTYNHRGYFDVSVRIYRNVGDTEFTQ